MGQLLYRANLTSAELPMLSDFQGRSVIVAGIDQNFSRQLVSARNKDKDIGLPQAYYGHNVAPTDGGFISIGYKKVAAAPITPDLTFTDTFILSDTNNNIAQFACATSGSCYVLLGSSYNWLPVINPQVPAAGCIVSVANVNGQSYIYFGGLGCFTYNFSTNTLVAQTLTALSPTAILGIVSANGYLIAWTLTTIAWSSTISPVDFTPSIITGAGGGGVQGLKGNIVTCLPHNYGFIIYTTRNAIGATYSNNAQYPFSYAEIIGAGGVSSYNVVSYDANSTDHYAFTTAGIQSISIQSSSILFPWVTDFLSGRVFEDFNESTLQWLNQTLTSDMLVKVRAIADRYLIISYGVTYLTHALLYDVGLERWGKFKITHTQCFEYLYMSQTVVATPKRGIGFLQTDGTVYVATMSYDTVNSAGVLLLGKYQYLRQQWITMLGAEFENSRISNIFNVQLLTSIDGKSNSPVSMYKVPNTYGDTLNRYLCRSTGKNHSFLVTGAFHLTSIVLKFAAGGSV